MCAHACLITDSEGKLPKKVPAKMQVAIQARRDYAWMLKSSERSHYCSTKTAESSPFSSSREKNCGEKSERRQHH